MSEHSGRDVHPSQRTELSQSIDGFDEVAVVRIETVLRYDRETVEGQLEQLYAEQSTTDHFNMASGESGEVQTFRDPIDSSIEEYFETVLTYVRSNNSSLVDLISVAVITDEARRDLVSGELPPQTPQHTLEAFFSDLSTINPYYESSSDESDDELVGLPITSLIVGIPDRLPPVKTAEDGLDGDFLQRFTEENRDLLRRINFGLEVPASAIVPDNGPTFIISNQSMISPFGPYSVICFHPDDSTRMRDARPTYRYDDAFRALVPIFRQFNWLRYRKSQIVAAENRLLEIDARLDQVGSGKSLKYPVGGTREITVYEQLLEDLRSDAMVATQIQQEHDTIGNPYREKTSLNVEIADAFPISEKSPLLQMVNDGVYQNLVVYCAQDEAFVQNSINGVLDRHQIIRESLFAEISVTSTRENIRLQYVILALTFLLLMLTGVLVLPTLTSL